MWVNYLLAILFFDPNTVIHHHQLHSSYVFQPISYFFNKWFSKLTNEFCACSSTWTFLLPHGTKQTILFTMMQKQALWIGLLSLQSPPFSHLDGMFLVLWFAMSTIRLHAESSAEKPWPWKWRTKRAELCVEVIHCLHKGILGLVKYFIIVK